MRRSRFPAPIFALQACVALACALFPDVSDLGGADGSSVGDSAPPDSSIGDSAITDASSDGADAKNDSGDGSVATLSNVQVGPLAVAATGGSIAPTLPVASKQGTLLVATLACDSSSATTGAPGGWALAVSGGGIGSCSAIWFSSNNAGGITSATFTSSNGGALAAQLSEWKGVTTVDQTGTASTPGSTTSIAVSTSAALALGGELGIAVFGQATAANALITYTPGSGWTNLGATGSTKTHYAADYRLGVGPGVVSETETSSLSTTWSSALATFK